MELVQCLHLLDSWAVQLISEDGPIQSGPKQSVSKKLYGSSKNELLNYIESRDPMKLFNQPNNAVPVCVAQQFCDNLCVSKKMQSNAVMSQILIVIVQVVESIYETWQWLDVMIKDIHNMQGS